MPPCRTGRAETENPLPPGRRQCIFRIFVCRFRQNIVEFVNEIRYEKLFRRTRLHGAVPARGLCLRHARTRPQRGRGSPAREPRGKELQEPGFPGIPRGRPHGNTRRGREFLPLCDRERKEQHPHPALVRPGELDEGRRGLYGGEPSADNRQGRGQPLGAGHQQDRRQVCAVLFPAGGEQQARHRRGVGPLACRALYRPRETDRQRRDRGRYFDRPVLHRGGRAQVHVLGKFPGHLGD